MPTPTDRFALDTYDPGESWDHTDTVQFLDEIAVERDTVANRPTSGTYDGEIFFATDEEIFYQWDGTNTQWNEVLNAPTQAEFDSHSTRHESGGADEIGLNNLDLPAGAQIDEDGGDLVVRDSGGGIVLRRDETAGTWDFVSGDLVNIASLEAVNSLLLTDGNVSADPLAPTNVLKYTSGSIDMALNANQATVTADNTATQISALGSSASSIGFFIVIGNYGSDYFIDLLFASFDGFGILKKIDGDNPSAIPTSYSVNSTSLQISIDDGGSVYDLAVWSIGGSP